jgi:hypothetical protein
LLFLCPMTVRPIPTSRLFRRRMAGTQGGNGGGRKKRG